VGEQRPYELGQQVETFNDNGLIRREFLQVFDDEAETLAPKPLKGVKQGLRRAIDPSLVHRHPLNSAKN
jgi:hypothetical protein